MAGKPKRMALYEAIRQGQAKIAKGLETGQMRSDGRSREKRPCGISDNRTLIRSKEPPVQTSAPFNKKWLTIVKSARPKPNLAEIFSPLMNKQTAAVALTAAGVLLLVCIVWFSLDINGTEPAATVQQRSMPAEPAAKKAEPPVKVVKETAGASAETAKPAMVKPEVKKESPSMPAGGPNVIVIQSIPAGRRDELNVLRDFFAAKGIETDIIIDRNGYALLVTKQGFMDNPESGGTDGYKLLQKIQKLGEVYPDETKDTKFGLKPFQDAYGYKR